MFYQYTNKEQPQLENTFLVHVNEKLIARVLKKIRQNYISKKRKPLNQINLKISYSKKHKLLKNSSSMLLDNIVAFIPDGIAEYQNSKHKITEQVGYDEDGYQFIFQASNDEFDKFLLDSALGLETDFEIENPIMKDNRFNLPDGAIEIQKDETAKIEIQPNVLDECELRFKIDELSPSLNFSGEFVKMPKASGENNYLLFRTKLFSIVLTDISSSEMKAKLRFTLERTVPLDEVIKFLKLFTLDNMDKTLIFETHLVNQNRSMSFTIPFNHNFSDELDLVDAIIFLKTSFEINGSIDISVEDLLNQKNRLISIANVIQNKVADSNFKVLEDNLEKNIFVPLTLLARIGKLMFGSIFALYGEQVSGKSYKVVKSKSLKKFIFDENLMDLKSVKELEKKVFTNYMTEQTNKL